MFRRTGSIQLARVFGIRVGVDISWFVVLFLVIFWLSDRFRRVLGGSDTTAYVTAVASALLLFVSIGLHELGHALAARRQGIGVAGITISLLGGFAQMSRESRTPREELTVAVAGPLATLGIIAVCAAVALATEGPHRFLDAMVLADGVTITPALLALSWLVTMNAIVLVFNVVPAYPLDGGRIVRALVWRVTGDRNRGTRAAARLGQGFATLLIGTGLWITLGLASTIGLAGWVGIWLVLIGIMIGGSARALLVQSALSEQLEDVRVSDIMDEEPVSVPDELPAARALDEFFLRYRWPWFPVVDGAGRFVGVLREAGTRDAVEHGRPVQQVRELMEADGTGHWRIDEDQSLRQLLDADGLRTLGAIMAVDGHGVLRGVVTAGRLRRALRAALGARS
jgi:Zn-dependent protease